MTNYCIGCDNIVGGESGLISKVASVLEKAGHHCEKLNVGPNYVQSKGLSSSSKGKTAVFIVGGSDIGTYVDFRDGIKNGYYHYKFVWFAFASWTATTDKWITENGLKNTGLVRAHDDNFSSQSSISPYLGKSADYFFKENEAYMDYVYGETPEELANKILGNKTNDTESSSSSTIKEALKEVLSGWDGDVECYIRDDTVYVHKIKDPTTAELVLAEGRDVLYDSVKITDVNPSTVNNLTVRFGDTEYNFRDDDLIKRFGEVSGEVTIDTSEVSDNSTALSIANTEWAKIKRNNGHSIECKSVGGTEWQVGQWVRVYLPSFEVDDYFYLSKVSQNDDREWSSNLTFVDYPPSLGEPVKETESEDEDENEDSTEYSESTESTT